MLKKLKASKDKKIDIENDESIRLEKLYIDSHHSQYGIRARSTQSNRIHIDLAQSWPSIFARTF